MGKTKSLKRKREVVKNETDTPEPSPPPAKRFSDDPLPQTRQWINKQRVLVFSIRGIHCRYRCLMDDLKKLMPHHKTESKLERSKLVAVANEMCEMKNCNKAMMFEGRKQDVLYLWISNVPNGPSVKFLVENVHTMGELKMTGNCLRGSRPLLSFDPSFDEKPQYMLLKELFTQIFGVPKHHPKSQPFFDHVYTFTILDKRIWFRNFQILSEDGALAEIGPRFVLNPVKIFSGSFGGPTIWDNPHYVSPSRYKRRLLQEARNRYVNRTEQKVHAELTRPKNSYELKPLDDLFTGDPLQKAKELLTEVQKKNKGTPEEIKKKTKKKGKNNKMKSTGQENNKFVKNPNLIIKQEANNYVRNPKLTTKQNGDNFVQKTPKVRKTKKVKVVSKKIKKKQ